MISTDASGRFAPLLHAASAADLDFCRAASIDPLTRSLVSSKGNAVSLTDQEVRKLALLARLDISDDEAATVRPQLESILQFVEKLSELDTDEVEPMTTALDVENRWRPDRVTPGLNNQQATANAPAAEDGCFLVPPVLGSPGGDS